MPSCLPQNRSSSSVLRRLGSLALLLLLAAAPMQLRAAGIHEKGPDPLVISNGQTVDLADYLVPGKTTVFDFYSEYCPTCRSIAPDLRRLHAGRPDLVVVLVNVNRPGIKTIDWQSPVAKQYSLPSTPQLQVFGPDGKMLAEGKPAYRLVTGWFR